MRTSITEGGTVFGRFLCLFLTVLLTFQVLPMNVLADDISAASHEGYLLEFDTAVHCQAFLEKHGGKSITDRLLQVNGVVHTWLKREQTGVISVCRNGYVEAERSSVAPNDELYDDQWSLSRASVEYCWNRGVNVLQNNGLQPAEVKVAVLDTGIDGTHPDLAGRVGDGYDAVTGEVIYGNTDSDISDDSHGTMVAGVLAASADNEIGIAGAAGVFPVTMLPVRVLNRNGSGTIADVVAGIYWALENGADIINMSFGKRLSYYPTPLAQAIADATDAGILVFAAAGNDGRSSISDCYPASITGVHPVGAYETDGNKYKMCSFSNGYYDKVTGGFYCGPGRDVLTTVKGGGYDLFTGTSASAAFVSGIAAFLTSVAGAQGGRYVEKVEDMIYQSVMYAQNYAKILDLNRIYASDLETAFELSVSEELMFTVCAPEVVLGIEDLSVSISRGASKVQQVAFVCRNEDGAYKYVIADNDGTDPAEYSVAFDFSDFSDGAYQVFAGIRLKTGDYDDDWWRYLANSASTRYHRSTMVTVQRAGQNSLLRLLDPAGCAMGTQAFRILNPETGETVYSGGTDKNGFASLPSFCFTNGQAVFACDTMEFCYRHSIQQATELTVGGTEIPVRTLSVLGPENEPVADVAIYLSQPEGAFLLGETGEDGTLTLAAEDGSYTFAAVSGDGYYPEEGVLRAVLIGETEFNGEVSTLCFSASEESANLLIPCITSENVSYASLTLNAAGMSLELQKLTGEAVYVSPGTWDIGLVYDWKYASASYTCPLEYDLKGLQLSAGEQTFAVDPEHLSLTLDWRTENASPNVEFDYDLYLVDSLGNRVGSYDYFSTTVHGGEMEGTTYSSYFPSVLYFPMTDCDYTLEISLAEEMYHCYPGVTFETDTVYAAFSYRVGKHISVQLPEGHDCWVTYTAFARNADGSTVKLENLGNQSGCFDAQELEYGTQIAILVEGGCSCTGDYRDFVWTWGGTYTEEGMTVALTDNAVRNIRAEFAEGEERSWISYQLSFDVGGMKVSSSQSYYLTDMENGLWIPADAAEYFASDSEWDEELDCSVILLWRDEIPAGENVGMPVWSFERTWTEGYYSFPCGVTMLATLPDGSSGTCGGYDTCLLKTSFEDAEITVKFSDRDWLDYEETSHSFTLKLPFPTEGSEPANVTLSPLSSISLYTSGDLSADQDVHLGVYLTDENGLRCLDVSAVEGGYYEDMGENEGVSCSPTVYYRLKGETGWTKVTGGTMSRVNLGILPAGSYEAKAEFDFTGYVMPENDCYRKGEYGVYLESPVIEFCVGQGSGCTVSASAQLFGEIVRVILTGTPGAAVTVYAKLPNGTEEQAGTCVLSEEGIGILRFALKSGGLTGLYAVAELEDMSSRSAEVELNTGDILPAPSGLTAERFGEGSIRLNCEWTEKDGLCAVLLREGTELARFDTSPAAYTDTGLESGRIYTYSLVLENGEGKRGEAIYTSARPGTEQDQQAPTVPGGFQAVLNGSSVTLSWNSSQDNDRVKAYIVYRDGEELTRVVSRSYTDSSLGLGQSHSYAVAAVDPSGNISASSETKTVKTSSVVTIDGIEWETGRLIGTVIAGESFRVKVRAASGLEDVRAQVRYLDLEGGSHDEELALEPYGQYYSAVLSLEGVARVESIRARVYLNGSVAAERSLDVAADCVARSLSLTLPADYDWDRVANSLNTYVKITLSSKTAGVTITKELHSRGIELKNLLPADDYTLSVSWKGVETARTENLSLKPGAEHSLELVTGIRVLQVNVMLESINGTTPLTDALYLNNRRYSTDSNGRVRDITGETAITLPAEETTLTIRRTGAAAMDGSGYSFAVDSLSAEHTDEITFYARPLTLAERTVTFRNGDGTPVSGVKLQITQTVPGGTFCTSVTTDQNGAASFSLLPDTEYTAELKDDYTFLSSYVPTVEVNGQLYHLTAEDAELTLHGWICTDDLTITRNRLTGELPLRICIKDPYGVPVQGTKLELSPSWVCLERYAVTDENGIAEFILAQTDTSYSVMVTQPGNIGSSRALRSNGMSGVITEQQRQVGTVEWTMNQDYSPEVTGLRSGEHVMLYLYGGIAQQPISGYYSAGKVSTGYHLETEGEHSLNYCLIPLSGAYWADTSGMTAEGLLAIGGMQGYADAKTNDVIAAEDGGCALTLNPVYENGEASNDYLLYKFISDDAVVMEIRACDPITVRLMPGGEFTVKVISENNQYASRSVEVTVPDKKSDSVSLLLKSTYVNIRMTDADGNTHPELCGALRIFDKNGQWIRSFSCWGETRIAVPEDVTGEVFVFARFGNDNVESSYMNLNSSEAWTKIVLDKEEHFNGQTAEIAVPLEMADTPTLRLASVGIGKSLSNVSVQSVSKDISKVSFRYTYKYLQGETLILPAGATDIMGPDSETGTYASGTIEFLIATALIEEGASVSVMGQGVVLQQVTLNADPFEVTTQNSISSSEIEFSEVKKNLPLLPENGYFRNMPKDAPLLHASNNLLQTSVRDLDKCYLHYSTTQRDYQVSVTIDGVPVNYSYDYTNTVNSSQMIMLISNSFTEPGYDESTGLIWQNSDRLAQMGAFDSSSGEGWLLLPYPEPESYPHTYTVSAVMRYADESEADGWHYETRTEQVTVYADTAYLRCFDFIHYDSYKFGVVEEELSETYWVRPKTEEERKEYQSKRQYRLNWNNTNVFTFRAYFEKPEEVESAWAVADVADNCEYYCFPLYYDAEQGIWCGTGQLGSTYCIPEDFGVNYVLKSAAAAGDYPTVSMKDLEAATGTISAELPEGWTAELTDPREMSLEDCLQMWEEYSATVSSVAAEDLNDYMTAFFGEDHIAPLPALKLTDDEGNTATLYSTYELDPTQPQSGTGRRFGVRLDDGGVMALQVITEMNDDSASRSIFGDLGLLMPDGAADEMSAEALSVLGAVWRGVKWGCEFISGGLDIYTKASAIVDTDAALTDKVDDWMKDLPADALEEYQDWQDKKAINDFLDLGLGLLSSLLPPSMVVTTAFDVWLFRKTNDVDELYKEIARKNRHYKDLQKRWQKTHPCDYDPDVVKYIDPSGYVFEAVEENRLEDVTATVLTLQDGCWVAWDSAAYGEGPNPQITNENGVYGWNVTNGKWKVLFEKEGYAPTESEELDVPPAHTDVNVGMVSLAEPEMETVSPAPGGAYVEFSFSLYMQTEDVLSSAVLVYEGEEITGTLAAMDEALTVSGTKQAAYAAAPAEGTAVAKTFRFTPEDALPVGASCFVRLKADCRAYNGKTAEAGDGAFAVVPAALAFRSARNLAFAEDGYSMPLTGTLDLSEALNCDGENYESRTLWESLSPSAFSVDQNGVVTTVGGGTGYIRVSCDGLTAVCAVADHLRAGRLTVSYLDPATGENVRETTTLWIEEGGKYSVEAPNAAGMYAETAVLSGTMSGKTKEITLNYSAYSPVYALAAQNGMLRFAFRDGMRGDITLIVAGYDAAGRMVWSTAETASDPAAGAIVSVDLKGMSAKRIRLFAIGEDGTPVMQPLELS